MKKTAAEQDEETLAPYFDAPRLVFELVRADNDSVRRPIVWSAVRKDWGKDLTAFGNRDAWKALKSAANTMSDYTETFDRAVIGYHNGEEVTLKKNNALLLMYQSRPSTVQIFHRPSFPGRCTLISDVADE